MKSRVLFSLAFFLALGCHVFGEFKPIIWKGVTYDDETVSQLVTVITSTNPIPSIPDTRFLHQAQKSLFVNSTLAACKKIIVFDGLRPGYYQRVADYDRYKQNVIELTQTDPNFANTELIFCNEWVHLAGAMKEAIKRVTTPFVFIHQHDLVLHKDFDMNGIIATMIANPLVMHVHFSIWKNNGCDWWYGPVDDRVKGTHFVPLSRSFGWSDQCHVSTTDYYKNFVFPKCGFGFMEQFLQPGLKNEIMVHGLDYGQKVYGTFLYGDVNYGPIVQHTGGRG